MEKQKFIQQLENGLVPFSENEKALKNISTELFEPYDEIVVTERESNSHYWSGEYFYQKIEDLKRNFSKELILHLIDIKRYLQEKNRDIRFKVSAENINTENEIIETTQKNLKSEVNAMENLIPPNLLTFQPRENLANALDEGDLGKIRSYLMSMLNNRRLTLDEVLKSIWYVHQKNPAVFEQPKETAFVQKFDPNSANWNTEYFTLQQVYLNRNFSLERLLHLFNVRETLMKKGDPNFQQIKAEQNKDRTESKTQTNTNKQSNPYQPNSNSNSSQHTDNSFIKTALLIGGAVLIAAIAIFSIFK